MLWHLRARVPHVRGPPLVLCFTKAGGVLQAASFCWLSSPCAQTGTLLNSTKQKLTRERHHELTRFPATLTKTMARYQNIYQWPGTGFRNHRFFCSRKTNHFDSFPLLSRSTAERKNDFQFSYQSNLATTMRPMFCSTTQKNEVLFFFDMCLRGVGKNILNHLSLNEWWFDGDLPPKKGKHQLKYKQYVKSRWHRPDLLV